MTLVALRAAGAWFESADLRRSVCTAEAAISQILPDRRSGQPLRSNMLTNKEWAAYTEALR